MQLEATAAQDQAFAKNARRALRYLCERQLRARWGMRLASLFGFGIFAGYAAAMLVLSQSATPVQLEVVALNAAVWLSWLGAGLAALSYARGLGKDSDFRRPLRALAALRGHSGNDLSRAGLVAAIRRIALVTGIPALMLAALSIALAPSVPTLLERLVFAAGLFGYILVLSLVLAWLARWAARISPTRAGATFVALALIPHLTRQIWPATPSVPWLFDWLLWQLGNVGSFVS